MAGTVTGGRKAAQKNLAKNPNFYAVIGTKGGSKKVPKGFARVTPEKRQEAIRRSIETRRRVATSQPNVTASFSDSSTTKPGQKPANDTDQVTNVKPSRRMSSFLGRLRKDWRG